MNEKIKFIHCSDLLINSTYNVNNSELVNSDFVNSNLISFKNIVYDSVKYNVDFIVISGNLFENIYDSIKSFNEFINILSFLNEKKIQVYMILGEKDNDSLLDDYEFPSNVHLFNKKLNKYYFSQNNQKEIVIFGENYSDNNFEKLLNEFNNEETHLFSIFVSHLNLENPNLNLKRTLDVMKSLDINYWALGNYDKNEILNMNPYIVYSGTIQGRNYEETGNHGYYLIEVDDNKNVSMKYINSSSYIFEKISIDISDMKQWIDLYSLITKKTVAFLNKNQNNKVILKIIIIGKNNYFYDLNNIDIEKMIINLNNTEEFINNKIIVDELVINLKPIVDFETRKNLNDFVSKFIEEVEYFQNNKPIDSIIELINNDNIYKKYNRYINSFEDEDYMQFLFNTFMKGYSLLEGGDNNDN